MKSSLRVALPWAVIVAVALVAGLLRYGFIEPSDMGHACDAKGGPWWCGPRTVIVQGFLNYGYGYAAVLAALVAVFWRNTFTAVLAASLGVIALQLYCYEGGALALLIGSLRLVRDQAGAAPVGNAPVGADSSAIPR
ncbi:hypothetical protein J2T07_001823 [Luteibacter jiangsuensis]|uniref:Vitamin K epoxide reductase family protein n=1 Tax=Luteibacter jiangsuensis TaxID=637577 RepID=A0ABT9SXD6_9GAMM|nr:hypothetical protein [Luteibacter jiangsuensis]MDQ0009646.1 hypothetical protein [Luteibacter jiangsuensis]